jgi:hypothetical protein
MLHEADQHGVHVPPGLDGVETANDDVELSVEVIVLVLDPAEVTVGPSSREV